ncbi:hypothetical protein FQZ97_443670 [compost metagenome]
MDKSHNQAVRKCRASVFALRLAQIVDIRPRGYRLAAWWAQTHGYDNDQPERNWTSFLRGTLPHTKLRGLLIAEIPGLQEALIDPLWWSLSKLSTDPADRTFWDSCAEAIEMNGTLLPSCSNSVMNRLCGTPSWTKLGFLLILLRSGSAKFAAHREWLRRFLFSYFCIALEPYSIARVAAPLFCCIDTLAKEGLLGEEPLVNWPKDQQEFMRKLDGYGLMIELLRYQGWLKHWREDDHVHPLLWLLEQDDGLWDEFDRSDPLPDRLRMRWHRTKERAGETLVTLTWSQCNQRGLTLSDKRVLRRVRLEADWVAAPSPPGVG